MGDCGPGVAAGQRDRQRALIPGNRMLNARRALLGNRMIRHRGGAMEPAEQARVERRLAAILAADVSGYSRLIEADEEGTLGRLKALRAEVIDPKIAGHKGRIV